MTREQEYLAGWLAGFPFTVWATWTFGRKWVTGPTRTAIQYHVLRWTEERSLQPAFVVAERGHSETRRWHAHGLLGGHGGLQIDPWRKALTADWLRRYGRCRFEPLHDSTAGVREYVAKYCLKGLSDTRWWITDNGTWT